MSKTAIFASENNESPLQTIRQTMQVSLDDSGNPSVSFATNRGKGSGAQSMSVADFRDAVDCLQYYVDNGIQESDAPTLSPAETIRQTISLSEGEVTFRTRSGKGSKPAKIPLAQFEEVVALLSGTVAAVEAAGGSLSPAEDVADEMDDSDEE